MTVAISDNDKGAASSKAPSPSPRWVALAALVLLVVIAGGTALALRSPAPAPTSAPATEFSADRAITHIEPIASEPHPTGSKANERSREYLVEALRGMGLTPQVDTRVTGRSFAERTSIAGTVSDVYATIPGTASTGKVVISAHYDSVPLGPGANDGAVNVSVTLEVARALAAGPKPRNDVVILLTDGEEPGLLGGQAFVDSGLLGDPAKAFVVNSVARGSSGPSIMFQTSDDNAGLMGALGAASTTATSFSNDLYRLLPNDTDLTVLAEAGARGMNFAYVGGSPDYHTPHDDIGHVTPSTVQDIGEDVLASADELVRTDLGAAASGAKTYFTVFGVVLSYPSWLVLPLALLAALGFAALLWFGHGRGLRPSRVGVVAATFSLPLAGAAAIGFGIWHALLLLRPEYEEFGAHGLGDTHRPHLYLIGEVCLLAAAVVLWFRWMRKRGGALEISVAVIGWLVLLSLVAVAVVPNGSYLFLWPAVVGLVAVGAALRWSGEDSAWRRFAGAAAAAPAMLLILPVALLLFPTVGVSMAAVPLVFVAVLMTSAVVLVDAVPKARVVTALVAVLVLVTPLSIGIGLAVDGYDAQNPVPVSLGYVLDEDNGSATWLSESDSGALDPVIASVLTGEPVKVDELYPTLAGGWYPAGPAKVVGDVRPPTLTKVGESEKDGLREVSVHLEVPAGTHTLALYADTSSHEVVSAEVNGVAIDGGQNLPPSRGAWRWGLRYAGPPSNGVNLTLRVKGQGPVRLRTIAQSTGLPAEANPPTLPDSVSLLPWPSIANQSLAARTYDI